MSIGESQAHHQNVQQFCDHGTFGLVVFVNCPCQGHILVLDMREFWLHKSSQRVVI